MELVAATLNVAEKEKIRGCHWRPGLPGPHILEVALRARQRQDRKRSVIQWSFEYNVRTGDGT
jgi:hypothetical protein